jgi:tRNA-splicing ligase RtcB
MPYEKLTIGGAKREILSWMNHEISYDEEAMLRNTSRLPCVFHHLAVMADGHLGKGALIGSVVATKDAIIPACVSVDIACGMSAIKTPFRSDQLEGKLSQLYEDILKTIPVGFSKYQESVSNWGGFTKFKELNAKVQDRAETALRQLGTLGGGNHFIEICVDVATEKEVWLVLHSGSRNIGKTIADYHISEAKLLHKLSELPDPNLAYFIRGTQEYQNYMSDLLWAQDYAFQNREVMISRLMKLLSNTFNNGKMFAPEVRINCHHNYVSEETHYGEKVLVTRKGAIRAGVEDMGIIPGSMGTHTYIVPRSWKHRVVSVGFTWSRA